MAADLVLTDDTIEMMADVNMNGNTLNAHQLNVALSLHAHQLNVKSSLNAHKVIVASSLEVGTFFIGGQSFNVFPGPIILTGPTPIALPSLLPDSAVDAIQMVDNIDLIEEIRTLRAEIKALRWQISVLLVIP